MLTCLSQAAERPGATDIRPFRVHIPGKGTLGSPPARRGDPLAREGDRRRRSQGVQLATMQKLARYWATDYDWRKVEARLNALPQFITEIDGLDIHFIHVRSKHRECAADHRHARLARLDHRAAEDHRSADQSHGAWRQRGGRFRRRDSVAAGLRVFRQADHDRLGPRSASPVPGRADAAPRLHAISWRKAATGAMPSPSRWRCRRRRDCSAFTPTCRRPFQPTSPRRSRPARRRRPVSRPTNSTRTSSWTIFYKQRPGLRQRDGEPPADALRHRGFARRPGRLDARPRRRAATQLIARVFDGQPRGADARRRPRQHHALLADEHGGLFGAPLLGTARLALLRRRRASRSRSP